MDKAEIAAKVSERSGVGLEDCKKVLDAFEDVLGDELADSKGLGGAFDKVCRVVDFFRGRKNSGGSRD